MISNSASLQKIVAAAVQLTYPFAIQYFQTEASARFEVYVGGVLQNEGLGNDYTLAETAAVNGISPGGDIIFVAQPTVGDEILIKRVTPRIQPNGFVGTVFPADSVEKTFDRNLMISQELQDEITELLAPVVPVVSPTNIVPDWAQAQNYVEDELVIEEGGLFRVVVDHLSTTFLVDFNAGKLERVGTSGIKGDTGDAGLPGAAGADSIVAGPQGFPGNDGADGVLNVIATPAQAIAGVDNAVGMTPLQTKNAIDAQVPNLTVITDAENDISQNSLDIAELNTRLNAVENMLNSTFGIWTGQQRLRNGQAAPLDILGLASGEGVGFPFTRDGDGTRYAEVIVTLERRTDLEHRFSSFKLIMQFVDGVWYIKREKTHVLVDALEIDGVTLTINNLAGNVGTLQYTSDVMPGVDNAAESNIKFKGVELSEV